MRHLPPSTSAGRVAAWVLFAIATGALARPARAQVLVVDGDLPTAGAAPTGIALLGSPLGSAPALFFTETGANQIGRLSFTAATVEFPIPTAASQPYGITGGPDSNAWFVEFAGNQIGRCTYSGTITEFPIPTAASHPWSIAAGPDGSLWFTENSGNQIGRITTAGVITEFPIPTASSQPQGIAAGSDGNLWFLEYNANKVGRITPAGAITEFAITTVNSGPYEIAAGMDGNLWFTEHGAGKIGRITPAGVITEFPLPSTTSGPYGIRAGQDGSVWFVEEAGNKVGRISQAGVITEFPIPTASSAPRGLVVYDSGDLLFVEHGADKMGIVSINEFQYPLGITSGAASLTLGPDGNLWAAHFSGGKVSRTSPSGVITPFTLPTPGTLRGIAPGPDGNVWVAETGVSKIARVTSSGAATEFPVPNAPQQITKGPDGNLWFTERTANQVGRITTAGAVTEFPVTTLSSGPTGITTGPDGALWFTEQLADRVGRITTAGVITEYPLPAACGPGDIVVGADGNLWTMCTSAGTVYPITPAGVVGASQAFGTFGQGHLAVGPDGNLWAAAGGNTIGVLRVSDLTKGAFDAPGLGDFTVNAVFAAGPDGNLWIAGIISMFRFTLPQVPAALDVDAGGNRVFDPGETVTVAPTWRNWGSTASLTAQATSFSGPPGATYTITQPNADYRAVAHATPAGCAIATGTCYQLTVSNPATRPQAHWDATLVEELDPPVSNERKVWNLHIGGSFADVPSTAGTYRFVETLLHRGVTAGCGGGNYCPGASNTRAQMAVFLLVAADAPGYAPPPCTTPTFGDVPCSSGFAPWIDELAARGVTAGCGGGNYCPTDPVTRGQMAVFLLRTKEGNAYTPPACVTPTFPDVPCSSGLAVWINELARRGITAGCGGGNYCPANPVTRGQMAVFLTTTFGLTLYGP